MNKSFITMRSFPFAILAKTFFLDSYHAINTNRFLSAKVRKKTAEIEVKKYQKKYNLKEFGMFVKSRKKFFLIFSLISSLIFDI